jgi:hypothetical protein
MSRDQEVPEAVFMQLRKTAAMGEQWHIDQAVWLAWQDGNVSLQSGWRDYVWAEVRAMDTIWPGSKAKFLARMKALRSQHERAASDPAMAAQRAKS